MFADEEWENPESVIGVDPKLPGFISPDPSITTEFDEYPDISGITNAREAMKELPEEDRAKIEQQVHICPFKSTFDLKAFLSWKKNL